MDHLDFFLNTLFSHLCKRDSFIKSAIIKKHNDKLQIYGEFSFPWKIDTWKCYINSDETSNESIKTIFDVAYPNNAYESLDEPCRKLVDDSSAWNLQICKYSILKERIHIFMNRTLTIHKCLKNLQEDLKPKISFNKNVKVSLSEGSEMDMSYCRLKLLSDVGNNLLICNNYRIVTQLELPSDHHIYFTLKSSDSRYENAKTVMCAPILNNKTGLKETEITTVEYRKKRTTDMQLIAQHKYGLRINNDDKWKVFLSQLGEAAMAFDLLQIKPSHSVSIDMVDNGSGCSKGASFVLYNCARLSSIINTFNRKVQAGIYPKLLPLDDVDLSLLNDEDEWTLIFNYILAYQLSIKQSLVIDEKKCLVAPHNLCSFLSGMVGRISMYYRRVRILVEPREHLLPAVFARMHLLLALQKVLHNCLSILNIDPVTQM